MKYYLCCGNKTGVIDPDSWIGIDLPEDVRKIDKIENADAVFATPPCSGFTDLPWRPATGKDLDVLLHCLKLCQESGAPWLLECNRWAQKYIGPAVCHRDGHYFWGPLATEVPPFRHRKMSTAGQKSLARAALPIPVILR